MSYNVLITDDNAVNRSLMIRILQKAMRDLRFFEASDGRESLSILREQEIDLNILDLLMPEIDGFEVIRRMKADKKLCDIPVIVNSSVEDLPSIRKIMADGANDYFSKPLKPEEIRIFLPLKVKSALARYEQHKKLKEANERNLRELRMASALQRSIMADYKRFREAEMFARYVPSNEIGGDFYDCVEYGGTLWFLIADVSGHGIAAAMVSLLLKGMFRDLIPDTPQPGLLLKRLNQKFIEIFEGSHDYTVSAFSGCVSHGSLFYANAGHPYPLAYRPAGQEPAALRQNGMVLGALAEAEYRSERVGFQEGDWLITYTDGVFGKKYGNRATAFQGLLETLGRRAKESGGSPPDLIGRMVQEAGGHTDDVSMMILRKL